MRLSYVLTLVLLLLVVTSSAAPFQKNKDDDTGTRSLQGTVRDPNDNPVDGAVVQLKNTKTLQVRSFITRQDGNYQFHGLSASVDFEVKADHNDMTSGVKRLSAFDSRTKAVVNLKLSKKQ